ncbi:hypothetical protein K435DRAFT_804824 [Dendrothele bispora CBS 962.96]|uniref:Uncharacterized protein n=1 Tax=Dendrothele bispora (strain CBS 962.96) TaxID=1314807 RepID=A0A4S8LDG6_DENBC|nr:hypothetical protein K435DRAFT_804824 [Dendrothele bispora CBS 962.96]
MHTKTKSHHRPNRQAYQQTRSKRTLVDWVKRLIFVQDMAKYVYRIGKRWWKHSMYRMPGLLEGHCERMSKINTDYNRYALESGVTTINGKVASPNQIIQNGDGTIVDRDM